MSQENATSLRAPEIYQVISSVGNHEVKSLVLASMHPKIPYSVTPLHTQIMSLQGETPAWRLHKNSPHDYCKTFATVGLVAEETVGANAALAFRLTKRGQELAKPLVGHLLYLSLTEEPPLLAFFGPTQTNSNAGIRPSQRRIELMKLLLESEGNAKPIAEVAAHMNLGIAHANEIVGDLAAHHMVQHESSGRGKPTVSFKATDALKNVHIRQDVGSQLIFDIVDTLQKYFSEYPDTSVSNADIAQLLIESGEYNEPLTQLIKKVSQKTTHLANTRKVLVANRDMNVTNARGVVWATNEQLETMGKATKIVNGFASLSEDYLNQGMEKVEAITSDTELVNHLVYKAKTNSIGRKRIEDAQHQVRADISSLVASSESPLTLRQIQKALYESGNILDRATIHVHMRFLSKLGNIAMADTAEGKKFFSIRSKD